MTRLHSEDATKYRFAGLGLSSPSSAKRRFVAEGRIAVPFMAWSGGNFTVKLIPISSQARSHFAETFRSMAASDPRLMRKCSMIADLIEHLESNVVGPDTYAFKSMDELVLNDKNTDERLVTINADVNKWCVPNEYEIAYRVAPPWFHTIGYAETVEDAAALVLEALRLAVRDEEN